MCSDGKTGWPDFPASATIDRIHLPLGGIDGDNRRGTSPLIRDCGLRVGRYSVAATVQVSR